MVFLAFASCFNAAKKSDIRISESSNWIKSAGVMPWRWAISNTSTIAHSTSSGLGSRDCSISLFIEPLTSVSVFMYSGQNRHSAGTLCFCAVQYCTPLQLLTWRSPRPGGRFFGMDARPVEAGDLPAYRCPVLRWNPVMRKHTLLVVESDI